jgi:hypothetical protein
MARISPAQQRARILKVTAAWSREAPRTSFWGMTLAQFKAAVQPCLDRHEEVIDFRRRLRIAIRQRNSENKRVAELISRVGSSVRGDPDHAADSDLYEAMGFTREMTRIQNIRRAKRGKRKPSA